MSYRAQCVIAFLVCLVGLFVSYKLFFAWPPHTVPVAEMVGALLGAVSFAGSLHALFGLINGISIDPGGG